MQDIFSAVTVANGYICTERKKMYSPVPDTKSAQPTVPCIIFERMCWIKLSCII